MTDEMLVSSKVGVEPNVYLKRRGEWVEFGPKNEVPLYVRYLDYGYDGLVLQFVTMDKDRAFKVSDSDDISAYNHLRVYQNEEMTEDWFWDVVDERWARMN